MRPQDLARGPPGCQERLDQLPPGIGQIRHGTDILVRTDSAGSARTGISWRYLPHDYPHWNTVYDAPPLVLALVAAPLFPAQISAETTTRRH